MDLSVVFYMGSSRRKEKVIKFDKDSYQKYQIFNSPIFNVFQPLALWLTLLRKYWVDDHQLFYVVTAAPKEEVIITLWERFWSYSGV